MIMNQSDESTQLGIQLQEYIFLSSHVLASRLSNYVHCTIHTLKRKRKKDNFSDKDYYLPLSSIGFLESVQDIPAICLFRLFLIPIAIPIPRMTAAMATDTDIAIRGDGI